MCQIGPCLTLRVEFDYRAPMVLAPHSVHTGGKSEAQLTKKQAVLLMHDIYKVGEKASHPFPMSTMHKGGSIVIMEVWCNSGLQFFSSQRTDGPKVTI